MFVCIARTRIDWSTLLSNAEKALGRSVTASLDTRKLPAVGEAAMICAASEFGRKGDAVAQLRDDGLARRHVSFTFLVNAPRTEFFNLSNLCLSVTPASDGDFAIATARMDEWVPAVVQGLRYPNLRRLFCLLHAWFECENLGELWSFWEKKHLPDGLYLLVGK